MSMQVRNISKEFPSFSLNDVSFTVEEGSAVYLVGLNGAGKTTLVRIALGLEKQDRGKVLYNGQRCEQVRNQIGVVLDTPPIYSSLTGYENVFLLSGKKAKEMSPEIYNMLKIDKRFLRLKGKAYSYGQRHRLSLAIALLRNPKYLILDEPFIGLDFEAVQLFQDSIAYAKKQGCSVLLTGQDYAETYMVSDVCVFLHEGSIVSIDRTSDIQDFGEHFSQLVEGQRGDKLA